MNQRIAIPTNEGKLWQHFGKAPQVAIVNVEDGKIVDQRVLQAPEHEHGAMPKFLAEQGCTDVLCGGLGQGAVNLLNQLGIRIHAGAPELPVDVSQRHHCLRQSQLPPPLRGAPPRITNRRKGWKTLRRSHLLFSIVQYVGGFNSPFQAKVCEWWLCYQD